MAFEAWKCVEKDCKGFIVFENADFDFNNIPILDGIYAFDDPSCTECGKQYKVVPHYTVITAEDEFEEATSTCITKFEKREIERSFENETVPYYKVQRFINMRGYSYSVDSVMNGYRAKQRGEYISYTMKDCVNNLEKELQELVGSY